MNMSLEHSLDRVGPPLQGKIKPTMKHGDHVDIVTIIDQYSFRPKMIVLFPGFFLGIISYCVEMSRRDKLHLSRYVFKPS